MSNWHLIKQEPKKEKKKGSESESTKKIYINFF